MAWSAMPRLRCAFAYPGAARTALRYCSHASRALPELSARTPSAIIRSACSFLSAGESDSRPGKKRSLTNRHSIIGRRRFSRFGAGYPGTDFSGSPISPCRAFAPLFPHIPISRLDTARKAGFVHYRRFAHHLAQRFAQLRKNRLIARELDREPHVVLRRRRDPRREPDRRKNACRAPRYRPGSRNRYYRDPHPQRVAGGGAAAVGSGIQRNVDLIERAKILVDSHARSDRDPARGDSRALEVPDQPVPGQSLRDSGEKDPGIRQPGQDLGPQAANRRRELRAVVERSEGDESVALDRRRVGTVDRNDGAVAPLAVGKADQGLGMKPVGHSGRVRVPVAEAVLDPGHPGRAQISQPGDLHRDLVHLSAGRVAIDLVNGPVVPLEQGNREKRDRVEVEIARNVADAKTPPRVPGIAGRLESPRNRPFEPCSEILVPRKKSLAGDPLGAGERKQLRGFDVEPVRVELSRRAENLQDFGYAGLAPENISQERVRRHA